MVERIRYLCELRGINFSKLERILGFANGSIAKTNENTQISRIKTIADYFGVTIEYLFNGEEKERESTDGEKYYFSDETAEMAQSLYEDKDMRVLFYAARGARPDDIKMAADMLKRFKETNPDG